MIGSIKDLHGYKVQAIDGEIGKVEDFFFDGGAWTIRYLVVDTREWIAGRLVLISPLALGHPDREGKAFPVELTREQVQNSPPVESDQPVSRQYEAALSGYYGWPSYWTAEPVFGPAPLIQPPPVPPRADPEEVLREGRSDPNLQSVREVTGYHILASDGEIGHVDDFLVDDENWIIRYMVVDTRNWLPGKKVLVAPQWIRQVDWAEARVIVDLPRERIKNSPPFTHKAPLTREYETALYDYYGVPPYWG